MIETDESRLELERTSDAVPLAAGGPVRAEQLTMPCAEPRVESLGARPGELEDRRTRERREMEAHEGEERATILRDFLEVADNLERAVGTWKEGGKKNLQSVQDGIDLVLRLFRSKLERHHVAALVAEGKPFDPRVHQAVAQAPSSEMPPGSVLREVQKGYTMDGRLLRPALVVVASAPARAPRAAPSDEARRAGAVPAKARSGYQRNRR